MIVFAVIPSLILLYILRKRINFGSLIIAIFILFIIGVIWDQISVRLGIWSFSQDKTIGTLFGMPIEEYIFMIFVPLLVITVFTLISYYREK